jgi:hypothetical protein
LDEGCARQRLEGGADTAVGVKIVRPCHATAGRFVPDVVPARPVRDVEHEGLALIALSQLDLTPITLTAADIKRESRFANSRLVWSYRLAPVGISMHIRVLQIVSDEHAKGAQKSKAAGRSWLTCRFSHARTECREEPAGKLQVGHPYRRVWRRGAFTPA